MFNLEKLLNDVIAKQVECEKIKEDLIKEKRKLNQLINEKTLELDEQKLILNEQKLILNEQLSLFDEILKEQCDSRVKEKERELELAKKTIEEQINKRVKFQVDQVLSQFNQEKSQILLREKGEIRKQLEKDLEKEFEQKLENHIKVCNNQYNQKIELLKEKKHELDKEIGNWKNMTKNDKGTFSTDREKLAKNQQSLTDILMKRK